MPNKADYSKCIGQKYGRLTFMYEVEPRVSKSGEKRRRCHCKCECGKETDVDIPSLLNGNTKSCGCIKREQTIAFNKKTKKSYNDYYIRDGVIHAFTSAGDEFLLDEEDEWILKKYCWHCGGRKYLYGRVDGTMQRLHRLIVHADDGESVDHKNGNVLDNRKCNLRKCSHGQNMMNKKRYKNNSSGVVGVFYLEHIHKWHANIGYNGELIHLGSFENFDDAVDARRKAEEKYFGKYAATVSRATNF